MKLETSQELLERVRAKYAASWYGLISLMGVHKNTVYSWKGGHTSVDKKFADRIAQLLDEAPEYVLACIEAEKDPDHQKLWERIAAKFRAHAASILLASLAFAGAHPPAPTTAYAAAATEECILRKITRGLRQRVRSWVESLTMLIVNAAAI